MTLTERAAAAAELKTTGQCNCTQSVVKVFEDKLPVEGDTLRMLAAGYAAGMGCLESTCGALIGAVMVAGILTEGRGTPAVARALVRSFEQRCGATICKELKGVATGVPLCPCPECVRNAGAGRRTARRRKGVSADVFCLRGSRACLPARQG